MPRLSALRQAFRTPRPKPSPGPRALGGSGRKVQAWCRAQGLAKGLAGEDQAYYRDRDGPLAFVSSCCTRLDSRLEIHPPSLTYPRDGAATRLCIRK